MADAADSKSASLRGVRVQVPPPACMCGIVGYIGSGRKDVESTIVVGLERLEYRGYDSAGIALLDSKNEIFVLKKVGKIAELKKALESVKLPKARSGIGHTRWATHGKVSEENAHPQLDSKGKIAIVHNGIIENFVELRKELEEKGHSFRSETDTEVIAHLLEEYLKQEKDYLKAILKTVNRLKGTFALAILNTDYPEYLVGVRKDSPLIVGIGKGEMLLASDIPAILTHTKRIIVLDNEEIAVLTKDSYRIYDFQGNPKKKEVREVEWDAQDANKGPYPHFMLKEIYEQPKVIELNIQKYIRDGEPLLLKDLNLRKILLNKNRFIVQAAGTSLHAGLVGRYLIEKFAKVPVEVIYSSEFHHREPVIDERTLVISISQSGETMDTLEGLRLAKKKGLEVLSIVNVVDSSIARESDYVIYINAGPEIGVASTKAYTAQIFILLLLALELGHLKGFVDEAQLKHFVEEIRQLPLKINAILYKDAHIQHIAQKYHTSNNFMFLGRGINYPTALEGALKLKEISYIHATGYAAGEMKHGPLALIDESWPVVVINPKSSVYDKTFSNANEVHTRGGKLISVITEGDSKMKEISQDFVEIPEADEHLTPILAIVPLQLLAYHIANLRGCDVDKPRNIAKVITVL